LALVQRVVHDGILSDSVHSLEDGVRRSTSTSNERNDGNDDTRDHTSGQNTHCDDNRTEIRANSRILDADTIRRIARVRRAVRASRRQVRGID